MKFPKATFIAPLLCLVLASGLFVQMRAYAVEGDPREYHAAIADAAERLPMVFGNWSGENVELPPAAGKLLRPNVLFSRRYVSDDRLRANLVLVQCFDARDMSGHYPPNCYQGNGWLMGGDTREIQLDIWGRTVPVARYTFSRSDGNHTLSTVIYNFFVLPTQGFVTSMDAVREATGDYRARPFGAAQVQVILDAGLQEHQRLQILQEILQPLGPVIDRIQSINTGETP